MMLVVSLLPACGERTRSAPPLEKGAKPVAATRPAAPSKGVLDRAADATWNVVRTPVRIFTPDQGNKGSNKAAPEPPGGPVEAVIVPRYPVPVEMKTPETQPAASQPSLP